MKETDVHLRGKVPADFHISIPDGVNSLAQFSNPEDERYMTRAKMQLDVAVPTSVTAEKVLAWDSTTINKNCVDHEVLYNLLMLGLYRP